jgi:hypothetical protein
VKVLKHATTVTSAVRHLGYFAAGAGALFASAALWFPDAVAATASASVPACIANGDYGQVAGIEDPNSSVSDDSRGTFSANHIAAGPTNCQRISSIYVFSPDFSGDFEFGWVLGWSNCSQTSYVHPHLFYWAHTQSGTSTCKVWSSPTPTEGNDDAMRVSDTNANTYWGSYFLGNALQPNGVNMDFSRGWSIVGMERGASSDSGYAKWSELQEYHDGNGWSYWDVPTAWSVNPRDPNYSFIKIDYRTAKSDN